MPGATPVSASGVEAVPTVSLVSPSGKRMHPRVSVPAAILFEDGRRYAARDWSVAGFSLGDDAPVLPPGAVRHVHVVFGLADCEVAMAVDAKAAWTAGERAHGFRFVGLTADKLRILDHFLQTRLEGNAAVVGGLALAQPAEGLAPRRRPSWTRPALQVGRLALMAGLVGLVGAYGLGRFLTVTADYAAVSARLQQVHAPQAGFLQGDKLAVGARLVRGEIIGALQPVTSPQARLSAESEIAALQVALDQQVAALDQARAGFATYLQGARTEMEEAAAARAATEQQVDTAQKSFDRVAGLRARGVVAQQRVDEEQQALLTLQRALSAARDAETAARLKRAGAEAGRFANDGRSTERSPADIEGQVATSRAALDRMKAMLAAADQPLPLRSPCDCRVTALAASPGAYLSAGAPLADLAWEGNGTTEMDALVQTGRLALVRAGQPVTVYLASDGRARAGHVTAVSFNPANTGRTGLPATLRTLDDYGLMTVALDEPAPATFAGTPASILAPVGWSALAAALPGAGWVVEAARQAGGRAASLWGGTDGPRPRAS